MSNTFDIPEDIESAVLDLKGLGELITASEWQRAALVWAFTVELGKGEKPKCKEVSISDFAKMGISGLSSRPTVAKYRKAWALAIEHGHATDVKPGDLISLPDVEWSEYFNAKKPSTGEVETKPKEDIATEQISIDTPKVVKSVQMVRGINSARIENESVRIPIERIQEAITKMAMEDNKDRYFVALCSALSDLAAEL